MKKLPLCESLGCVAKNDKCTDVCRASFGCPDELADYQEAFHNAPSLADLRVPLPHEIKFEHKWSDATNHIFQAKAAAKMPCIACNDSGIVDGEFDGALECACRKGTNR